MARITKIEVQKRNKERVNLFLDGEYAFSLSAELVYKEGLKTNNEIDAEKLEKIAKSENLIRCKETALKIIGKSYKTEKEVRDKLRLKGYDNTSISYSIDFLRQYNFINDDNYIKAYINDKLSSMGREKIKYTLVQKGIAKELIEEQLSQLNKENERNVALNIGKKKIITIKKKENDNYKISGKLFRYLVSKGYGIDICNDVVKEIMHMNEFS